MSVGRLAALLTVVALMSAGQILFKLAAKRIGSIESSWEGMTRVVLSPYLASGVVVYGITTVLWVLILVDSDLSRTYPFVALTMVLVPLAGLILFQEEVSVGLLIGGGLILAGLAVIAYA